MWNTQTLSNTWVFSNKREEQFPEFPYRSQLTKISTSEAWNFQQFGLEKFEDLLDVIRDTVSMDQEFLKADIFRWIFTGSWLLDEFLSVFLSLGTDVGIESVLFVRPKSLRIPHWKISSRWLRSCFLWFWHNGWHTRYACAGDSKLNWGSRSIGENVKDE